MSTTDYAEFEVWSGADDGLELAAGASGPREKAWREALHYADVYAQDGPVSICEVTRRWIPASEWKS